MDPTKKTNFKNKFFPEYEELKAHYPNLTDRGWLWIIENEDRVSAFGLGIICASQFAIRKIEEIQSRHGWLDEQKKATT